MSAKNLCIVLTTLTVIAAMTVAIIVLVPKDTSPERDYEDYVKEIVPYEVFQQSYRDISEPADLTSPENYAIYIEINTRELKKSLSLEEVAKIAEFYASPLGKRFLQLSLHSEADSTFLSRLDLPEVWTCNAHPQIRVPTPREKCPICNRELVRYKYITGAQKEK